MGLPKKYVVKSTAIYTAEVDITGKGLAQFVVAHGNALHFRIYAHSPPNHLSPTAPEQKLPV